MEQQTVHLFVFDTLADWEPAFAIAGLNNPASQTNPGRYRVKTVGIDMTAVTTIGGVRILPDMTLAGLKPADSAMLILPGGEAWDAGQNLEAVGVASDFIAAGVPVAAICGATAALARAGMLEETPHTSNGLEYLQATNYQGAAHYQDVPAVTADGLITASGSAPIEFAHQIFQKLEVYPPELLAGWYSMFQHAPAT